MAYKDTETNKQLTVEDIRKFCEGCDNYRSEGIVSKCSTLWSISQIIYIKANSCPDAKREGVRGIMEKEGFFPYLVKK